MDQFRASPHTTTKDTKADRIALVCSIGALMILVLLSACNVPGKPSSTSVSPTDAAVSTQAFAIATVGFTQGLTTTQEVTSTVGEQPKYNTFFNIILPDGSTFAYTDKEQKKAVNVKFKIGTKIVRGPTLLGVLRIAGITQFTQVVITGPKGSLTLLSADIDDKVVLSFTSEDTFKLAGPKIPEDQWIKDVSEIRVQ